MSAKSRERQKRMVAALVAHKGQPYQLTSTLLKLVGAPDAELPVSATTTQREILQAIGRIMSERRMLLLDVDVWAQRLIDAAETATETVPEVAEKMPEVAEKMPEVPENVILLVHGKHRRKLYLAKMVEMIETGLYTHAQVLDEVLRRFPDLNRSTVNTVLTDLRNPKYKAPALKDRVVGRDSGGKLFFERPFIVQTFDA